MSDVRNGGSGEAVITGGEAVEGSASAVGAVGSYPID